MDKIRFGTKFEKIAGNIRNERFSGRIFIIHREIVPLPLTA
jgi:hypothetical protein